MIPEFLPVYPEGLERQWWQKGLGSGKEKSIRIMRRISVRIQGDLTGEYQAYSPVKATP
jgi:hypothetical protein